MPAETVPSTEQIFTETSRLVPLIKETQREKQERKAGQIRKRNSFETYQI